MGAAKGCLQHKCFLRSVGRVKSRVEVCLSLLGAREKSYVGTLSNVWPRTEKGSRGGGWGQQRTLAIRKGCVKILSVLQILTLLMLPGLLTVASSSGMSYQPPARLTPTSFSSFSSWAHERLSGLSGPSCMR